MEVPLARGLATRKTMWAEAVGPAARLRGVQVTSPEARVPPAVAETKVVLAGTVSVRTTPDRKGVVEGKSVDLGGGRIIKKKESGESVLEEESRGAGVPGGEEAARATGEGLFEANA